jgi:hypothetical protein
MVNKKQVRNFLGATKGKILGTSMVTLESALLAAIMSISQELLLQE